MGYTNDLQLTYLRDYPEYLQKAAVWFSSKWGIPPESYLESMQACIEQPGGVPQWYVMLNARQEIAAGAGIIENDFHNRKDLSPNLCALYVEPDYRRQGIAAFLLDAIRKDAGKLGISMLYLVTDHTSFYERCGWKFITMVRGDDGTLERMYAASPITMVETETK